MGLRRVAWVHAASLCACLVSVFAVWVPRSFAAMLQPWQPTYGADGKLVRAERALIGTELSTNLYREGCQSSDVIASGMVTTGALVLSPDEIRERLAAELIRMWARWPKMLCSVRSGAIIYETPTDAEVQERAAASVTIVEGVDVGLDQHLNRVYDVTIAKTPVEVFVRICAPGQVELASVLRPHVRAHPTASSRHTLSSTVFTV